MYGRRDKARDLTTGVPRESRRHDYYVFSEFPENLPHPFATLQEALIIGGTHACRTPSRVRHHALPLPASAYTATNVQCRLEASWGTRADRIKGGVVAVSAMGLHLDLARTLEWAGFSTRSHLLQVRQAWEGSSRR